MEFMDFFVAYLENSITDIEAESGIKCLLPQLASANKTKDYAKAVICLTYFKRYHQYNHCKIKANDFLLFIRDFVLYIGRLKLPKLVTELVKSNGKSFDLFVAGDGNVDVVEHFPEHMSDKKDVIRGVYSLDSNNKYNAKRAMGDYYINNFTSFSTYKSFEQKVAVHAALELPDNHTMLVSLPTGGGKSLISQLLAASEEKLTIVIVPTVSLAKDQYLQAIDAIKNVPAKDCVFYYRGGIDNKIILEAIEKKIARLIITSPEAIIKNKNFNQVVRNAAEEKYLHNVVIDEAHIVPDWGVLFRPEFQLFSIFLKELRLQSQYSIRTYLLSATLSEDVVNVLFNLFGSDGNNVQYRCDSLRAEPRYSILSFDDITKRTDSILEMIKFLPKPLIVYVIKPQIAEFYRAKLKEAGFYNIFTYTGLTSDTDRESLLEKWKNNELDVMIATSAFGMGVDKGNVRTILHACIPENLNRFYQEVGRAGRDSLPSLSVLAYYKNNHDPYSDAKESLSLVQKSILKKENIVIRFRSMLKDKRNVIKGDSCLVDLNTTPCTNSSKQLTHAGSYNLSWNLNALLLLHRQGYIDLQTIEYDVSKKTYIVFFKLLNVDILENETELGLRLAQDRQYEFNMRMEGYYKMMDIIHHPTLKCWGKVFVTLYPYAMPICSGCPAHVEPVIVRDDDIRIRRKCVTNIEQGVANVYLRRLMGRIYNDMIIHVDEASKLDINKLCQYSIKLGLSCLVYPDNTDIKDKSDCFLINYTEFFSIAEMVPWILKDGFMVILGNDSSINNRLFETANNVYLKSYKKVWCCNQNIMIQSRNKRIIDFMDCRIHDLDDI